MNGMHASDNLDDLYRVAWVTKRVNMVLERLSLTAHRRDLYKLQRDPSGKPRMTFRGFREFVPGFPLCLDADPVGGMGNLRWKDLSRELRLGTLRRRYEELYRDLLEEAAGRVIGLVVPMDIRGGMLIHNGPHSIRKGVLHIVAPLDAAAAPSRIIAEPFKNVLDAIGDSGWEPGMLAKKCTDSFRKFSSSPKAPPARVVQRVGPGAALSLLHWLVGAADSGNWAGVGPSGASSVSATDEEMAEASGLSVDQVRRALSSLEHRRWIERFRVSGRRVVLVQESIIELFCR